MVTCRSTLGLAALNGTVLGFVSLDKLNEALELVLLLLTIGFTTYKWFRLTRDQKRKVPDESE